MSELNQRDQAGSLETVIENEIGWITFAHPSHNSLPSSLLGQLASAILELGTNTQTKALVVQSGGDRTFCAGANLREMAGLQSEQEAQSFFNGFGAVINAIRTCGKLVIGRVQGKAVGGGVGLASAMDYCLATKWSLVRLSELSIGIGPFVIGPAVRRKMGLAAFSELSINCSEWQTAAWAKQKGLYQEVFDTQAHLDDYLARFLEKIRDYSPEALSELKRLFWEETDHWDALLRERAGKSARLLIAPETQAKLAHILVENS